MDKGKKRYPKWKRDNFGLPECLISGSKQALSRYIKNIFGYVKLKW